ncbi:MAG: ATP-binding protein [Pseudomonadota bacterium]|nr:ATP-binding protein [Pseudomonadota bacterium]
MADSNREWEAQAPPVRRLVEALAEPALIVEAEVVRIANSAARTLLGASVEGEDVRRAFGHPAAAERLLGGRADADEEAELVGLGEADRRWRMHVADVGEGAMLVRLIDRSEAQAAEQMRVNFVANASHELRTPLATLVGYAETLRERGGEIDEETRARFIGIVHDEARRMQRLVEDLISLSRIEAERFSVPTDALSLQQLVEEARAGLDSAVRERASEIRIHAEPELPPIAGDRSQILQMIDNVLANALRYGRKGTPVIVTVARSRDMLRLTVTDEGEGIAPEHLPRITERFYRADPSRSRSLGGTGLGLSIVKHIVERHRGRLTIESVVGQGTSVHVLLPVAGAAA